MENEHDIMAYLSDLGKAQQTVEEIWHWGAPEDVESAIMDALGALDHVRETLKGYLEKQEKGES